APVRVLDLDIGRQLGADELAVDAHPGDAVERQAVVVHQHALHHEGERVLVGADAEAPPAEIGGLVKSRAGADEAELVAEHAPAEKRDRLEPIDAVAARGEIRAHRELARVVLAVVVEALVADAALDRDEVEVDALGLDRAVAQRLEIIVFIERQRELETRHTSLLSFPDRVPIEKVMRLFPICRYRLPSLSSARGRARCLRCRGSAAPRRSDWRAGARFSARSPAPPSWLPYFAPESRCG